jgi:hypothetical protein
MSVADGAAGICAEEYFPFPIHCRRCLSLFANGEVAKIVIYFLMMKIE